MSAPLPLFPDSGQRTDIAGRLKRGLDRAFRSAASRLWVQLPTASLRLPYGLLNGSNHPKAPSREQRRRTPTDKRQSPGTPHVNSGEDALELPKEATDF